MIYIIIALIVIIVFLLLTNKYRNIYKLIMVFGKKGSGKSTYLIKTGLKYQKKGYTIYTNMLDCTIPLARLIKIEHLGDFVPEPESVLLLDEVGMVWDARDFKNFKTQVRDFFKLQRHYHVIVYLASQTFDIDKKLRDLTDKMILNTNLFNVFSLGRPISKSIVLTESTSEAESRIAENLKFTPIWNWNITYIPKYISYFNSFDVPEMPKLAYTEVIGEPVEIKEPVKERVKNRLKIGRKEYLEDTDEIDRDTDKIYCLCIAFLFAILASVVLLFVYFF